jgi:hypothetical protein
VAALDRNGWPVCVGIRSSFNLTENAFKGRQLNHAVVIDNPPKGIEEQFWEVFSSSRERCELFMEDLIDLFRKEDHETAVKMWLSEEDVKEVGNLIVLPRLVEAITQGEDIVVMPNFLGRKDIPDEFKAAVVRSDSSGVSIDAKLYGKKYNEIYKMPIMHVGADIGVVFLGTDLIRHERSAPIGTKEEVDEGLAFVEAYINTVDASKTNDPTFVKASMFEALLYCVFAPFFNEYTKMKRRHIGLAERRGPRYLYLLGPSSNGKSTFLTFAYKLVTGQVIVPPTTAGISRRQVFAYAGNSLFVAFDDIHRLDPNFETVLKSYWEMWWKEERIFPQLVFASNKPLAKKWAEIRTKVIRFDVRFENTSENQRKVNDFLARETRIFPWLAKLMLDKVYNLENFDDELRVAREAFLELYHHAGRQVPDYFPSKPLESIYDINKREWELLRRLKKIEMRKRAGQLTIDFSQQLEVYEVERYVSLLPQSVKADRKGRTIVVDTPDEFLEWIGRREGFFRKVIEKIQYILRS